MGLDESEVTEHHSENPNDKYEVRHCDKPETPYGVWEGDTLVKCFELEEDKQFTFDYESRKYTFMIASDKVIIEEVKGVA